MVTQKLQFIFCDFGTNIGHWVVSESVHIILQAEQKRYHHLCKTVNIIQRQPLPFCGGRGRENHFLFER